MLTKVSTLLRNDYASMSKVARESEEPIYTTKNDEGDCVFMNIEAYEKSEQGLIHTNQDIFVANHRRV